MLKVAQAVVDNRRLSLQQVQALAQSSLKSTLDVSFEEVAVSEAELALFHAENDVLSNRRNPPPPPRANTVCAFITRTPTNGSISFTGAAIITYRKRWPKLDHYLRDHRTGEVRHFDPRLFDLLHELTASLNDSSGEIDVVCGYRTPWSNEFLRTRSAHTGVARAQSSHAGGSHRHSAYREFRPQRCGMPRSDCIAEELATIAIPTSSTWTWDACATGS